MLTIDVNFEYGYETKKLDEWETAGDLNKAEIVNFEDKEGEIDIDFDDLLLPSPLM